MNIFRIRKSGIAEWCHETASKMFGLCPRCTNARFSDSSDSVSVSLTFLIRHHLPIQQRRIRKGSHCSSGIALLALTLGLGLTAFPAAAQTYMPPDRGLPGRREGGGTRGGCVTVQPTLTAIAPQTNFGLTTQAQPTLLWYVPPSTAQVAEFELRDEQETVIESRQIPLTGEAGILKLPLSQTNMALESGRRYHWYFSLVCDPQDRSGDILTEGWIERIQPNPELESQLTQASPIDRATLYAEAGIWYDALAALMNLQATRFDQAVLSERWTNLLSSVNLANLADKPYLSDVVLP